MNFDLIKIKDLPISIIDGDRSSKYPKRDEFRLSGIPFLNSTNIKDDRLDLTSANFITQEKFQTIKKGRAIPGDIIMTTRGSIGKVARIPPAFLGLINAQMLLIRSDENIISGNYIFQLLRSDNTQSKLRNFSSGAAQPQIPIRDLQEIELPLPPLPIQRRIASILSAYDDLIENNTRRIAILEEMARRIYEEWFVKFKFPGHEKVKMVDSELGKIPEGWEVGYLSDILESIRYATRPGDHLSNRRYVPIDCIARKSLVLPEFKPWEEAQSSLVLFEEDDILFGAMRPYFHKVCIAPFPGITRTTCFVLRARDYYAHAFGVLTAFADATVSYASAHTQGATIPYAVWDGSLADYKVLIPTIELLKIFEETVSPMLNWLKRVTFKQTNLRTTRDFLLPKLISGEIDVSQLPEPEEAAA